MKPISCYPKCRTMTLIPYKHKSKIVMFKRTIISFLPAVILLGCSNLLLPDFELDSIDQYPYRQKLDGLEVVVQPFLDTQENEKYFGIDFLTTGYVPILIIVNNLSTNSYIIWKNKIVLEIDKPIESAGDKLNKDLFAQQNILESDSYTAAYFSPATSLFLQNEVQDLQEVKRNLLENEFQTTTISPGKEAHGFMYFKLPQSIMTAQNPLAASIDAYNIRTKQTSKVKVLIDQEVVKNASSQN